MCSYWVAQKKTPFSRLNREPALWLKMDLLKQLRNLKRFFFLFDDEVFLTSGNRLMLMVKTDTARITSNIPLKACTVKFRLHLICFGLFQFSHKQQSNSSLKILFRARCRPLQPCHGKNLSPKSRPLHAPSKNTCLADFLPNFPGLVVSKFFVKPSRSRDFFCV